MASIVKYYEIFGDEHVGMQYWNTLESMIVHGADAQSPLALTIVAFVEEGFHQTHCNVNRRGVSTAILLVALRVSEVLQDAHCCCPFRIERAQVPAALIAISSLRAPAIPTLEVVALISV